MSKVNNKDNGTTTLVFQLLALNRQCLLGKSHLTLAPNTIEWLISLYLLRQKYQYLKSYFDSALTWLSYDKVLHHMIPIFLVYVDKNYWSITPVFFIKNCVEAFINVWASEAYLGPREAFMMEEFAKIVIGYFLYPLKTSENPGGRENRR